MWSWSKFRNDIACTNISLDLFGQVRSYFQYAAKLQEMEEQKMILQCFEKNVNIKMFLLVEQPNTILPIPLASQFLFDVYHLAVFKELQKSKDLTLSAIANKCY